MSTAPSPATLTFEQMMALFHETRDRQEKHALDMEELRQLLKEQTLAQKKSQREQEASRLEREKQEKKLNQKLAELGDRIGELIEMMVENGVVRMFKNLGYDFDVCCRHVDFRYPPLGIDGEIDFFLENGEIALLVEVKTNLTVGDVRDHLERMTQYRTLADAKKDKRQFIAAVAGGVIRKNVRTFALKQGMYVIQQSGDSLEIIPPVGKPKVW